MPETNIKIKNLVKDVKSNNFNEMRTDTTI